MAHVRSQIVAWRRTATPLELSIQCAAIAKRENATSTEVSRKAAVLFGLRIRVEDFRKHQIFCEGGYCTETLSFLIADLGVTGSED